MKIILALILSQIIFVMPAQAEKDRGGGDAAVVDFVYSARAFLEWWRANSKNLSMPMSPTTFEKAIDPNQIVSTNKPLLLEDREVDAIYDKTLDLIIINRNRWFDIKGNQAKMRLAGHEIFRRAGASITLDDVYEYTSTLDFRTSDYFCQKCSSTDPFQLWRKKFLEAEVLDWSKIKKEDFVFLNKTTLAIGTSGPRFTVLYLDNRDLVPRFYAAFYYINHNLNKYWYWRQNSLSTPVESNIDTGLEYVVQKSNEWRLRVRKIGSHYIIRQEACNKLGEWVDTTYASVEETRDYIFP